MIISFVIKIVKSVNDSEMIVFVNCSNFNPVKKVMYFFVIFFYVEIRISIVFFLNRKSMNFLIVFLNIILKVNK